MKVIITKDGSLNTYEGVTAIKYEKGTVEFDYINRFRISPEDDVDLTNKVCIHLTDSTIVEIVLE